MTRLPIVKRTTVLASLERRQASEEEQAGWTDVQREIHSCMHCKTPYRAGSGGAWICEHWHEGL